MRLKQIIKGLNNKLSIQYTVIKNKPEATPRAINYGSQTECL